MTAGSAHDERAPTAPHPCGETPTGSYRDATAPGCVPTGRRTSRNFWSASWADSDRAWNVNFNNGNPNNNNQTNTQRVRPFRGPSLP